MADGSSFDDADCSKISKDTWLQLEKSVDYLDYATYGYEKSLKQMEKFENSIEKARVYDSNLVKKIAQSVRDLAGDVDEIRDETDIHLNKTVKNLGHHLRKFRSSKPNNNDEGYEGFDNLLKTVRLMGRALYAVNENWSDTDAMLQRADADHEKLEVLKKRLEELRIRWTLTEISGMLLSTVGPQDNMYPLFSLPALLTTLIFKPTTSEYYSTVLIRTNRKLIQFLHSYLMETNPTSPAFQMLDGILRNGASFNPSDVEKKQTIKLDTKKTEVNVEKLPLKSASDADLKHGEVTAPANAFHPIAKDSQISLASTNLTPKPCTLSIIGSVASNSTGSVHGKT